MGNNTPEALARAGNNFGGIVAKSKSPMKFDYGERLWECLFLVFRISRLRSEPSPAVVTCTLKKTCSQVHVLQQL